MNIPIAQILHRIIRHRSIKPIIINLIIAVLKEWAQYTDNSLTETSVSDTNDRLRGRARDKTKADKVNKKPIDDIRRVKQW